MGAGFQGGGFGGLLPENGWHLNRCGLRPALHQCRFKAGSAETTCSSTQSVQASLPEECWCPLGGERLSKERVLNKHARERRAAANKVNCGSLVFRCLSSASWFGMFLRGGQARRNAPAMHAVGHAARGGRRGERRRTQRTGDAHCGPQRRQGRPTRRATPDATHRAVGRTPRVGSGGADFRPGLSGI